MLDEVKQINLCSDKAFTRLGMKSDSIVSEGRGRHFGQYSKDMAMMMETYSAWQSMLLLLQI